MGKKKNLFLLLLWLCCSFSISYTLVQDNNYPKSSKTSFKERSKTRLSISNASNSISIHYDTLDNTSKINNPILDTFLCHEILNNIINFIDSENKIKTPISIIFPKDSLTVTPFYVNNKIYIQETFLKWLEKKYHKYPDKARVFLTFTIAHEFFHFIFDKKNDINSEYSRFGFTFDIEEDTGKETLADQNSIVLTSLMGEEKIAAWFKDFIEDMINDGLAKPESKFYQQLTIRKKFAEIAKQQATETISFFKALNYCLAIGKYDYAIEGFPSVPFYNLFPEAQNNHVAALLLSAINGDERIRASKYILPIEIDNKSTLKKFIEPQKSGQSEGYRQKLKVAKVILNNLLKNFPNYHPAKLNQLCFLILNGTPDTAIIEYNKLDKSLKDRSDFKLAKAIAHLKWDEGGKAKRILDDIIKKDENSIISEFAKLNVDIANEKDTLKTTTSNSDNCWDVFPKEQKDWKQYGNGKIEMLLNEDDKNFSVFLKKHGIIQFKNERFQPPPTILVNYSKVKTTSGSLTHYPDECSIYQYKNNKDTPKKITYTYFTH